MNPGESHPRDPEVAYKMRKIQITNKKKIGNCRLVRLSKTNRSRFEIPNRPALGRRLRIRQSRQVRRVRVGSARSAGAHLSGP
jgi:hypothetical protein